MRTGGAAAFGDWTIIAVPSVGGWSAALEREINHATHGADGPSQGESAHRRATQEENHQIY